MQQSRFIDCLDSSTRKRLASIGRRAIWVQGTTIFAEGHVGDTMLLIETGRAQVETIGEDGEMLILGQLGPGDLAGEMSFFNNTPRCAGVLAASSVTGIVLRFADVKTFLIQDAEVTMKIMMELAEKLRLANQLAGDRAVENGNARLARCLMRLADRWGKAGEDGAIYLTEKFSQAALGSMAGLARENVNRRLGEWKQNGWIAHEGRHLLILAPGILLEIAGSEHRKEG